MARFNARYVHKVSQVCTCGHTQYGHALDEEDGKLTWGKGRCRSSATCACPMYQHPTVAVDVDLDGDALGDEGVAVERLVEAGLLCRGEKLRELRREADGKVVVFPDRSVWHSIILTPVPG